MQQYFFKLPFPSRGAGISVNVCEDVLHDGVYVEAYTKSPVVLCD